MRALFDDSGNRVDEAGPSIPVQVCILYFSCCIMLSRTIFLSNDFENLSFRPRLDQ